MDIVFLLISLWRKKFLILGVTGISVAVAILVTRNMPESFRSVSQISTGFITNEGIKVNDENFNIREADLKFANLVSMMKSGVIYNQLSYRLALHDIDSTMTPFRNIHIFSEQPILKSEIDSARFLFKDQLENMRPLSIEQQNSDLMIKILRGLGYTYPWITRSIVIKRVPATDYIQIEFVSEDRNLSAFAVNAYFEEFIRHYTAQKAASTGESVEFFSALVSQKKAELDQKNDALQRFKTESNFLGISDQGDINLVSDLENQRAEINSTLYGLQLKLDYLKEGLEGNGINGASSVSQDNQKVFLLRNKINDLNSRYINSGSSNSVLADSLSILRQQLSFELSLGDKPGSTSINDNEDLKGQIKNTEIEMAIERSKLSQLNTKIRELQGVMTSYVSKEAALNALDTEVKVASAEYIDAVNRYNDSRNVLLAATSSIKQVVKAVPSPSPLPNNRIVIVGFSGVLSFSICLFVLLIIEILEGSIKTRSQFENIVDIPLVGSLVKIETSKVDFENIFSQDQKDKRNDLFKHFLRNLRFEIETSKGKSFLITSTKKGAGKSFVIFSLAFVLSRIKKKVLIIDTNFKSNELTKTLHSGFLGTDMVKSDDELAGVEVLSMRSEENQSHLKPVIHQTRYKGIFIIGNRGGHESPEEVFPANEFKKLLGILETKFDYILLEGPALNEYADSKELIKYVDKIITIFSAGTTIKQLDRESIEYLLATEEKLLGAVLNRMDHRNINL